MRQTIIILLIISKSKLAWTQNDILPESKIYHLNYYKEITFTVGLLTANYFGYQHIRTRILDENQIGALDKNDIWFLDRHAVEQNYSSYLDNNAKKASDWGLFTTISLPVLLYLDKSMQNEYLDIMLLYFETQAISTGIYTWGATINTTRIRPFVYFPEETLERKLDYGTQNSFFSGHTSTTATASFFIAKVFIDYHPDLQSKKWLIYSAALLPPVFVAYNRYKALMHFPTDVFVGFAVGAAAGIFVPTLHKLKFEKAQNFSITPFTGNISGLAVKLKF